MFNRLRRGTPMAEVHDLNNSGDDLATPTSQAETERLPTWGGAGDDAMAARPSTAADHEAEAEGDDPDVYVSNSESEEVDPTAYP